MKAFTHNLLIWKLAITKAVLYSLVTFGVSWQVSTAAIDFGSLHLWERVSLFIGMFVLWGNQMIAFLDKTADSIQTGKPLVGFDASKQKENG